MIFAEEDIKNMLIKYKDLKKEEAVFGKSDGKLEFLEHCLKYLEEYERDIIEKTYVEGLSVRRYSAYSGFSRNFISKQREKSVVLLTKFFNVKFNA